MFNGEGDGIGGLIIDYYVNFAVFSWYNETLYLAREVLLKAFKAAYPEIVGIYEKIRFETTRLPESQHVNGEEAKEPLLVQENGVTYATYLNEGLMTGIFLDQKEVRGALIDGLALGKSVLNMFKLYRCFFCSCCYGWGNRNDKCRSSKTKFEKTQVNNLRSTG